MTDTTHRPAGRRSADTIVVAFSHSAGSREALRWALREATRQACRVEVLHVYDVDEHADARRQPAVVAETDSRDAIERRALDVLASAGADVPVALVHEAGALHDVLCRASRDARLLVLGEPDSPRHRGLEQRLRAEVGCPVVTVPAAPR